jgi:imidazoleglycerol-phosphate dehydratase
MTTPATAAPAATVVRETRETQIRVTLARGEGRAEVDTSEPFLDHMLTALARYAGLDLTVHARGDLKHHLIEDVGIAVGEAVRAFAPPTAARYGDRTVPMDDALVHACVDLGGRAWYEGPLPARLYDHWMQSFAFNARATLHLRVLRGRDRHHVVEAAFKALGLALREALADSGAVFSTKGAVALVTGGGDQGPGVRGQGTTLPPTP